MRQTTLRATAFFALSTPFSALAALTGADLERLCSSPSTQAACAAYIEGAIDGEYNTIKALDSTTGPRVGQYFCLPDDVKNEDLKKAILDYIVKTPNARDYHASSAVAFGLGQRYRCRPEQ